MTHEEATRIIITCIITGGVGWIIKIILDAFKNSIERQNQIKNKLNNEIELLKSSVISLSEIIIYYIYKNNNLNDFERETLVDAINNYLAFNKNERMSKLKEKILNEINNYKTEH